MKKITITWKKIAKGEALPCDSFIRSIDDTVHSKVYFCSRGVTVGQNAYFLPASEFYDWQTDERIRKSLIDFLSQCKACYGDVFKRFGIDIDDALAWLEKLGEWRPIEWSEDDRIRYLSCLQRLGTGGPEQPETVNSKWFKEHILPQRY